MIPGLFPVCRPLLPPADAVAAYIRRSDQARHYTNRGPLVRLLEERLAVTLGLEGHAVRTTSSGTSAIEVAILASAGPADAGRPLALMPSFTFAATALAAERCGYRPLFADIDPASWALDPARLADHPDFAKVGVVISVAPFGRVPDMAALERFHAETGRPVILDAAAAFEQLLDTPALVSATVPLTISFHATKTFSTGEGGAVFWRNAEGQERVEQAANFGFHRSRETRVAGTNAKMSDYHAAVGLAMLDGFAGRRQDYARVCQLYAGLAEGRRLPGRLHLPPCISSAYVLLETPDAATLDQLQRRLLDQRIESRKWYESGLHVQRHFASAPLADLPHTADLSGRLLGLPMAPDLTEAEIARVLDALV